MKEYNWKTAEIDYWDSDDGESYDLDLLSFLKKNKVKSFTILKKEGNYIVIMYRN